MSYDVARKDMVENQIRARGIKNQRVIDALLKVPRHLFVSVADRDNAYGDYPLPIGEGQTISQPYMVAWMTEALDLEGPERVLEVGTGSGYQGAVLAELAKEVYTIERHKVLAEKARKIYTELGYQNIAVFVGDGTSGLLQHAPYDAIIVTAGAPCVPQPFVNQLAQGGRLVIPIGDPYVQILTLVEKKEGKIMRSELGNCVFVPLIGEFGWQKQ